MSSRWTRVVVPVVVLVLLAVGLGLAGRVAQPPGSVRAADVGTADPVIGAAGDIACSEDSTQVALAHEGRSGPTRCQQKQTSDLLIQRHVDAVLPLGDVVYECGDLSDFETSYNDSWGRLLDITHPAVGNHEYGRICHRNSAAPYFTYFGARAGQPNEGWYSYDIGAWHLIALNSECSYGKGQEAVGGCNEGSLQVDWLKADLAAHHNACTLAYWHEPRFSSGEHGDAQQMATIWNLLTAAHVDVVLSGHNHDYERFDPIGPTPRDSADHASTTTGHPNFQPPVLDPAGSREFVVGTGGKNSYRFDHPPLTGEVVRDGNAFGVLLLTLHPTSYDWKFISTATGRFADAGTGECH